MKWLNWDSIKKMTLKKTSGSLPIPYIVIMLTIGVLLIVLGTTGGETDDAEEAITVASIERDNESLKTTDDEDALHAGGRVSSEEESYVEEIDAMEKAYEDQLKATIEGLMGVRGATVMVTLESTGEKIYEKNRTNRIQKTREEDANGGERTIDETTTEETVVTTRDGDKESVVQKKTANPEVRGVLIVAEGADNIQVKSWIIEAVTKSLGVPPHRVSVLPKKRRKDKYALKKTNGLAVDDA
ncbi:stage III sporulation protein AG [Bacillaceae bacterium SIJ1]|uniref:stage III sporulation protein AG n=1 Tax=Litoribacterium kuwaitense TaxID=1398745 RepID=UPI0013E9EE7F|nr:stage III sporulation protein AG [Litoribacterium kuwaitense]NGP43603.1 stage III sporulation protein AG [Litoribacterium kuwaitense]